ncbi:MAG: VWA domain-containing protein [Marinibacterium sp.]|nr:VWA domain-containing protein [Marinibacterium sp.]
MTQARFVPPIPALLRGLAASVLLGLGAVTAPGPAWAQDRPLTIEGKSTVFQRVLTRPDAKQLDGPGGGETGTYRPFSPLYVYKRDGGFLQVGPSPSLGPDAWIAEADAVDWRQNIVASFTNPAGRSRQLMFETEAQLKEFMEAESLLDLQPRLLDETDAFLASRSDDKPADLAEAGILSVEPAEHVDIRENFYILPILGFTEDFHPLNYDDNIRLRVASLPLRPPGLDASKPEDFDVGIVFVIDTTSSMDPFIAKTLDVVRSLVDRLSAFDIDGKVNFGIVAFRDDTTGVEGLEYRVKEVLPLERRADQGVVISTLETLDDATVSSSGFNEDSLTAVAKALDDTNWEGDGRPFGGRYVVLITDAGPKLPRASDAYEHMPADLQAAAEDKGVGILTFHLKTKSGGEANHDFARTQYETLSQFGGHTFYYPVERGDEAIFGDTATDVTKVLKDDILTRMGRAREVAPGDADAGLVDLGYAMQLAYLGKVRGTAAPDVFEAWVSQFAVEAPTRRAVDFRLLITKNELATMAELVEEFIALGEELKTPEDLENFHSQIREVILKVASNPDRIVNADAEGTGDAMEFLSDLPYRSQILRIGKDRWIESSLERREVLDGLRSKLRRYQRHLRSDDEWTVLYEGAPDGEHVTAMPIRFLP